MGTNTESNAFPSFPWDELLKAIRLENRQSELLNGWESGKIRASYVNPIFRWEFPIYCFDTWTLAQCENFNKSSQGSEIDPDGSQIDEMIKEFE